MKLSPSRADRQNLGRAAAGDAGEDGTPLASVEAVVCTSFDLNEERAKSALPLPPPSLPPEVHPSGEAAVRLREGKGREGRRTGEGRIAVLPSLHGQVTQRD